MGTENRRQRRLGIQLNARAESGGILWDARIRDFCRGGLLLECKAAGGNIESGFRLPFAGEQINVSFVTPFRGQTRSHQIPCKVAHVEESRFGTQFLRDEEAAWKGLVEAHKQQSGLSQHKASESPCSPTQRKVLIEKIAALVNQRLRRDADKIIGCASELLLMAAERAHGNQEQAEYLGVAGSITREQDRIIEEWLGHLSDTLQHYSDPSARQEGRPEEPELDHNEMSLVDRGNFDQWVASVGVASRLQADLSEPLYELEQRLSALLGSVIDKENNPLDPGTFILAFVDTLTPYAPSVATERILLGGLAKQLREALKWLYPAINQLLIESGVVPVIAPRQEEPRPSPSPPDIEKQALPTDSSPPGRRKSGMFGNLQNLFSSKERPLQAGEDNQRTEVASTPEVLDALHELASESGGKSLRARLKAQLLEAGGNSELEGEVEGTIQATENLVAAFQRDEKIRHGIGDLVEQLDAPLAKMALEQPDFLDHEDHPASGFMQDLEKLAVAMSNDSKGNVRAQQLQQAIDQTLTQLASDSREGSEAFAEARDQLAPFVERAEHQFQVNTQRVADTHEGEERLHQAHRRVAEEINRRIHSEQTPRMLIQLIRLGWDNLLLITLLHQGPESGDWRAFLTLLEQLTQWLEAAPKVPDPEQAEAAIALIERGFSEVPANPARQEHLIELMRKVLRSPKLLQRVAADTLPYRHPIPRVAQEPEQEIAAPEREHLAPFAETIRGIQKGDWLVERKAEGLSRPLNLVWRDQQGERFAFVDGKGLRALEAGLYTLARRLERSEISLLEDGGLPLVQRAVQDVLRQTYDTLLQNSQTDKLTGLPNRRSFTRQLSKLIEESASDHSQHTLLAVDADQFKLIRDICGHEGADQLLIETTNILKTYLGSEATLARIGDDEFGALIRHSSLQEGTRLAETLCKAMESYRFTWVGRKLTATISIGATTIDRHSREAEPLLKEAISACDSAKRAGGNRVEAFEGAPRESAETPEESEVASRVEGLIQQGKLLLFVQLISPVFLDEGLSEHYEVLLRVLDDQERPCSPETLIKAAEGSHHMRILDRWVIVSLFAWIERNREHLEQVGGFSINLSGQSIDDAGIIDLITEELKKTRYPVTRISFEITETAMIGDMSRARNFILRLKELGCRFYLDDFGSGLASYTYLKDLPVDCVKIDGSFVKNIASDENDYALVKSITETAHFMKKRVIAEFVSDEPTLIRVRELEVDYAQGFELGRPFDLIRLIR